MLGIVGSVVCDRLFMFDISMCVDSCLLFVNVRC